MEEGTPPRLAELLAELRGMTLGQLLEKAELVGVDDAALDDAGEEQEVVALIVAQLEEQLAAEEAARAAWLREELSSMKPRAVYRKAQQLGVDKQQLDVAKDKAAIIALIAELSLAEASGGTDPQPEPEAEPEPGPDAADGPQPEPESGYGLGSQKASSGLLRMVSAPDPQGTVRILDTSELQNAIFVSYSRRHAGALNATNVIVNALRWKLRAGGSPYSRACHSGALVPWMDKEQMAQSGGEDWARVLTQAQIRARLSVFFLSNAYCGSDECLKELQFADVKKFERIPVFLERFVDDEEAYRKTELAELCDPEMKSFDGFQVASNLVTRLMTRLQGVPGPLDLSQFTCDACRYKRDTVCERCTDWSLVKSNRCWPTLNQMAEQLGTYIDGEAIKQGLLEALDRQLAPAQLASATGEAAQMEDGSVGTELLLTGEMVDAPMPALAPAAMAHEPAVARSAAQSSKPAVEETKVQAQAQLVDTQAAQAQAVLKKPLAVTEEEVQAGARVRSEQAEHEQQRMTSVAAKSRGNSLLSRGDYQGAVDAYTEAIKQDPTDKIFYSNRSAAYASMQKFRKALKDGHKCVELDPTFAKGYGRVAAALHGLERFGGAFEFYTKGLAVDPNNAQLQQGLEESREARVAAVCSCCFSAMSRHCLTCCGLLWTQDLKETCFVIPLLAEAEPSRVISIMDSALADKAVQAEGCLRLTSCVRDGEEDVSVAVGAIETVLRAMDTHGVVESVQDAGCACLAHFAKHTKANSEAIAAAGGIELLLRAMETHDDVENIQANSCRALCYLAEDSEAHIASISRLQGVPALQRVKKTFAATTEAHYYANKILALMMPEPEPEPVAFEDY